MLNVVKNLANSEKAVAVGMLIIAASVLAGMGKMSIQQWMDYTTLLTGFYVAGKTVQGTAAAISDGRNARAELAVLRNAIVENDTAADAAADELE